MEQSLSDNQPLLRRNKHGREAQSAALGALFDALDVTHEALNEALVHDRQVLAQKLLSDVIKICEAIDDLKLGPVSLQSRDADTVTG
jgi:hypothetical protein